jgi:iron complex outermembrane receptor protein
LNTGIAAGGVSGRDVDEVATAITGKIDSETHAADLRFDITFADYDLVSISTYDRFEQEANSDADGTSAAIIDAFSVPQEADAYSQEFQLLSTGEGPWQWIVGAYYFHEDTDFEILIETPELISQGDQNAKTTAWAIFGQTTYDINASWSVTVGGRWSFEEKDATVRASSIETTAPNPFDDSADWDEFTPRVTLEYRFEEGMAYVSYARGFKSGGYNYAASLNDGQVLNPEILDMFEVGWKTEMLAKRLRFNGSFFYYDYDDLQVTRAISTPQTVVNITENAANAEVLGIDLDLTWLITDRLMVTAGLNVLDTEYTEFDASANVFNAVLSGDPTEPGMSTVLFDASGEDLLRAPDWSGFASARYVFHTRAGTVPVVLSYSYTHDYQFDFTVHPSTERLRQDGYGLLSARASYVSANEQWTFSVWGTNLTDEDDYFADIVANVSGIRGSHGAPRMWGVDVSYQF